jgi:hypothetical protein
MVSSRKRTSSRRAVASKPRRSASKSSSAMAPLINSFKNLKKILGLSNRKKMRA